MKILMSIGVFLLIAYLLLTIFVRVKPINYQAFEYPPAQMPQDGEPHDYRLLGNTAPHFEAPPEDVMQTAKNVILNEPRTKLIKEDSAGWALYKQRSFLMGYPDFISIQAIADENNANKSRLEIVSRSLYGKSDLGVNKKRVENWIEKIRKALPQNP